MSSVCKVGLIQMAMVADRSANIQAAVDRVRAAVRQGAEVVCLPELFNTLYFCQVEDAAYFDWAESVEGAPVKTMSDLARELSVFLLVPWFECRAPGVYHNSMVGIGPDGHIKGHYRKMHIPDDPGFSEKFFFAPGDLGFQCFDLGTCQAGPLICWDQWYPEAARLTAMQGANTLFYPTAIGWLPSEKRERGKAQRDAWMTVQRSHAISNGCYVVSVNRVGFESSPAGGEGIEFWGSSFVVNPQGEVMAQAGEVNEEVLVVELDFDHVTAFRQEWPFFRDRRIDAYAGLSERWLGESL